MDAFVWDQSFVTGLPAVDEQHHRLVDLFNELNESLFAPDDQREAVLRETFERIVDYTRYHFRDEEELMREQGLDSRHIEMHHGLHEEFVLQVQALWDRRSTMARPSETFVGFLTSWLSLHILGIDQSMARQIQAIRSGVDARTAFDHEAASHDTGMRAVLKLVGNLYHILSRQNMELAQANQHLEQRVAERTRALEQAYQQLEAYSRIDGLLQIANRKYFDVRLQDAWTHAFRNKQSVGLLMIDVDDFKRFNDTYGHQAGDSCLQAVAGAVKSAVLRDTDLVARYGGEELAVILPDTDEAGTAAVASRVVEAVAALVIPHRASDAAAFVTVSVGAAHMQPPDKAGAQTLVAHADAALYHAKQTGRNRWSAYSG